MIFIVLAILIGVYYIISSLLTLICIYKPTIKDIYIVVCIILLWVLGDRIAAEASGAVNKLPTTNATRDTIACPYIKTSGSIGRCKQ